MPPPQSRATLSAAPDGIKSLYERGWTVVDEVPHDLVMSDSGARRTIHEAVAQAAARVERLEPAAAQQALREGAVLVDIRSDPERARDGIVPGSVHVPRTVLEWRLDPASEWRSPHAPELGDRVLVLCSHGFSSVLAAASLVDLGFARAGDIVGGFAAWREAGLPVALVAEADPEPGALPGMAPPAPAEPEPV
jgi:rhodanese-related sulfurtransferase